MEHVCQVPVDTLFFFSFLSFFFFFFSFFGGGAGGGGGGASGDLVLAELPAIRVCQAELVRPEKTEVVIILFNNGPNYSLSFRLRYYSIFY